MKYLKILGLLAVAATAVMAFAASASATSVTTTTGGATATPKIHLEANGAQHTVVSNPISDIPCKWTAEATIESHGAGVTAKGNISVMDITDCTDTWHMTAVKNGAGNFGSLEIHWTSGHDGALTSTGIRIVATRFGITCNYETNNTSIGSITGGNPATLNIEASIPIASGSSFLCGSGSAKTAGSLVTTSMVYVEQ